MNMEYAWSHRWYPLLSHFIFIPSFWTQHENISERAQFNVCPGMSLLHGCRAACKHVFHIQQWQFQCGLTQAQSTEAIFLHFQCFELYFRCRISSLSILGVISQTEKKTNFQQVKKKVTCFSPCCILFSKERNQECTPTGGRIKRKNFIALKMTLMSSSKIVLFYFILFFYPLERLNY